MKKIKTNIIVAFHIGRGGQFYNPGYREYIGECDIWDIVSERLANDTFVVNRDSDGKFCKEHVLDGGGNEVVDAEDWKAGVGTIDIDGNYDSYEVMRITDCDEDDLGMIVNEGETWTDAYKYAAEVLGIDEEGEDE